MNTSFVAQVLEYANQLGFELAAFIHPKEMESFPIYERWVENGNHANMEYLSNPRQLNKRQSPLAIQPSCRSILVVAFRYQPDEVLVVLNNQIIGRAAAYTRGQDYHRYIQEKLDLLIGMIQSLSRTNVECIAYVDTGPILERELAVQAGIGWIGKNSCLINPEIGSYIFLAEILMDLELPYDLLIPPRISDHCGTCRRCIEACPTQCILENRTIDANRCISYLTIENKGAIPVELRPMLSDHFFGCDICQQVCPWNQQAQKKQPIPAEKEIPTIDVFSENGLELGNLTLESFKQQFKDTAFLRSKRKGLLRNACVVLGNSPQVSFLPFLENCLQDPEPLVRTHAAWALGEFKLPRTEALLKAALNGEYDRSVLLEIEKALVK